MKKMKIAAICKVINRYAVIHICLCLFFLSCWISQYIAVSKMDAFSRQFLIMNDKTLRCMTLIDLVSSHTWGLILYFLLVFAMVLFLQTRRRTQWICWLTATILCIPLMFYLDACAYISGKFIY
jgi:hypothetical protein